MLNAAPSPYDEIYLFRMLAPEVSVRLLPASMDTFLPLILMLPLGALIEMPVKALIDTLPQGELMSIARRSVEPLIFQMPYLSPSSTPPSKALLISLSDPKKSGTSRKPLTRLRPGVKLAIKAVAPLPVPSCTLIYSPLGACITADPVFSEVGVAVETAPTTKGRSTLLLA